MRINFILSLSDAQGLRVADPNLKKKQDPKHQINRIQPQEKPGPHTITATQFKYFFISTMANK